MRLGTVLTLTLLATALAASGCISPGEAYDYASDEWDEESDDWQEQWEDEEWDCPEDDADDHDHDDASSSNSNEPEEDDCYCGVDPEGEVTEETIETAFTDADVRYSNLINGDESSERTISVGLPDGRLRVGLVHELHGDVEIRLRNTVGMTMSLEEFSGEKEMNEEEWYTTDRPMPGDWTLELDISGHGGYTVGFYLDN